MTDDDLIERAEAFVREESNLRRIVLVNELVAALKAEQAANDDLVRKLKAATAENEQLRDQQYGFGSMYSAGSDV